MFIQPLTHCTFKIYLQTINENSFDSTISFTSSPALSQYTTRVYSWMFLKGKTPSLCPSPSPPTPLTPFHPRIPLLPASLSPDFLLSEQLQEPTTVREMPMTHRVLLCSRLGGYSVSHLLHKAEKTGCLQLMTEIMLTELNLCVRQS